MSEGKRQLAMVFDINKCMGCHTCTVACKLLWANSKGMDHIWYMKVNSLPGRGYPKDWEKMGGGYDSQGKLELGKRPDEKDYGGSWEFNYQEVFYGGKGQKTHLAPKNHPDWGPNWEEDLGGGEFPNSYLFYLPRLCNHCSRPACAEACSRGAIVKRDTDGIVTIQTPVCAGCSAPLCINACPYKEVYFNPVMNMAQKCDACLMRIEKGVAPACVRQCPGRMVWIDFMDNTDGMVYKLVKKWQVALPLHAEFGTEPNIFYVPPLAPPKIDKDSRPDYTQPRIPLDYLQSLFGKNCPGALETLQAEMSKRKAKQESELMDILVARQWKSLLGPYGRDPSEVR